MANISMDPRPTNYLRQNIVFSYPQMIRVSFSLFLCLSVFCYFTLLLIFIKIVFIIIIIIIFIYFHENVFFSCSGMFRNVPFSGFYRRPADLNLTPVTGTTNGFIFQIINLLIEFWGVRLTCLDCNIGLNFIIFVGIVM